MGEKIRDMAKVSLQGMNFLVELNDGTVKAKKPQYIHLQNERFRLALSDKEFIQMAVAVRVAGQKLRDYKELGDEDR